MKINIKKYIITFFILIVTFVIGAEQKIPNIMVLENPVKEVTTIEGLKNKEAAEMNIKVKKRDIEEIEGIETKDSFEFIFSKDNINPSEKIVAVGDINEISEKKLNIKKINKNLDTVIIENQDNIILKVPKNDKINAIYFIKYNNTNSDLIKVYKGNMKYYDKDMIVNTNRIPIEIVLKRDSNGNIVNQEYTIWERKIMMDKVKKLKDVGQGYEDHKIVLKKLTYSQTSEVEVLADNKLEIEGDGTLDISYSKVNFGKDGGFEKNDKFFNMRILEVRDLRSRAGNYQSDYIKYNSRIYQTFRIKIDGKNQGNYDKKIGVYEIKRIGSFSVWLSNMASSYGNDAPLRLIIQRNSKNVRITVREKELSSEFQGKILWFTELEKMLDYDVLRIGEASIYTLENLTPESKIEIAQDNLKQYGIKFPNDLKSGIYKVRIKWQTEGGTPINGANGDILTISYQKDETTNAKLDLSDFSVGSYGKWAPMTAGKAQSIEGDPYIINIRGYLPEVRDMFNRSKVAKLDIFIKEDGISLPKVTVNGIENSRIVAELENNIVGYESNGDLFITKKKKSKKTYIYGIHAYDKNNNKLGSCSLEVINDKPIDMGTVAFTIDERLYSKHVGWFDKNGQKYLNIPISLKDINNYEELVRFSNSNFKYPQGINLTAEGVVGLTKKSEVTGKGFIYGPVGTTVGDIIIPDKVLSEDDFNRKLYVLNNDNLGQGSSIRNKLEYIGNDNKYYFTEVVEVRGNINTKLISGSGRVDLSNIKATGTVHSFSKNLKPGTHKSNGAELVLHRGGTLPQTQGYKKENIVDNLDITVNGGTTFNIVGNSYENENYRITLNKDDGDFEVEKLNIDNLYDDTIDISYKYKDIKLGEFNLNIKNEGLFFEIIGDDSINFGNIIQGKDSVIDGKVVIKNLNSKKIVHVEENANKRLFNMTHKSSSALKLRVYKTITLEKKGTEVPINIELIASPKEDQYLGDYEGVLNLHIYIE